MNLSTAPPERIKPKPPTNPLKDMRLLLRLSQEALARRAGVTRQLVIRAEQGVYPSPPPALLETLLDHSDPAAVGFPLDETVVYHLYKSFQLYVRRKNYGLLLPSIRWGSVPVNVHPWVEWRMRSGIRARIGPAKLYCIHPALLHKFEVQPHLCQSPPGDLLGALREAGYSSELLDEFVTAYDHYKAYLSGKFKEAQTHG